MVLIFVSNRIYSVLQNPTMAMSKASKLPQEIVIDILTRLPAKSIGQFRCVSKQWYSFLSDPQFIKAHLTFHCNQDEEKLIIVSEALSLHIITFTQNGNDCMSRNLNFQQLSKKWVRVHGSCNGLVLVENYESIIFLINPTTLEYHEIPRFDKALQVPGSFSMYGFGYDVVSDDYKVVTLSYYHIEFEYCEPTFVDVYSMRKGIWRRLGSSPYHHIADTGSDIVYGVLVNGALHWLAFKPSDYSYVIVAFDLSKEKFLEVPTPTTLVRSYSVWNKLVALRGRLCLFIGVSRVNADVWMMNDYGVEESWTKFVVQEPDYFCDLLPLWMISEDDVVLDVNGELIVYNIRKDQLRNMMVYGIPTMLLGADTGTFRESLVSPKFG